MERRAPHGVRREVVFRELALRRGHSSQQIVTISFDIVAPASARRVERGTITVELAPVPSAYCQVAIDLRASALLR